MKLITVCILLLLTVFTISATELGLDLVTHLEIKTEADLAVVQDLGIVSLYSTETLANPLFDNILFLPANLMLSFFIVNSANITESYSDLFLHQYGNDYNFLSGSAVSSFDVSTSPDTQTLLKQEVYVYRGNIIGRERLAEILGMDDYFVRKSQYWWGDFWASWARLMFISSGVFLINYAVTGKDYIIESAGAYALLGGACGLLSLFLYPSEPLWDHEKVQKEIITYNMKFISLSD